MRVRKVGMAQVVLVPQANKMYLADLYGDFVKVDDNDDEYECDCYRTTFPLQFDDEKNATAFFSEHYSELFEQARKSEKEALRERDIRYAKAMLKDTDYIWMKALEHSKSWDAARAYILEKHPNFFVDRDHWRDVVNGSTL